MKTLKILIVNTFCIVSFLGCARANNSETVMDRVLGSVPKNCSQPSPRNVLCDYKLEMKTKTGEKIERTFKVFIPANTGKSPAGSSVLFVFHGSGGDNSAKISEYSGFNQLSQQNGFVAVYPEGYSRPEAKGPHWNDNRQEFQWHYENIDDIAFIHEIIKFLQSDKNLNLKIDHQHLYGAGISNGGVFVHWASCKDPQLFHAVASVAATMSEDMYLHQCSQAPAKPTLMIFGSADNVMPYDADGDMGQKGRGVSVFKTLALRGKLNHCTQNSVAAWKELKNKAKVINLVSKVPGALRPEKTTYTQIDGSCKVPVRYIEAQEAGHRWHNMKQTKGPTDFIPKFRVSREFDSQQKIFEFFKQNW